MAKTKQTYEHREHEIQLTDAMEFRVVEFERTYPSYAEAQAAIDRKIQSAGRVQKRTIEVAAITEKGAQIKITGLHAGHGNFLMTPKVDRYFRDELYVDSPLTREAANELTAAQARVSALKRILRRFQIEEDPNYDPSRYGEAVDDLVNSAAEMLAKAGKTTFAAELEKELKD